MLIGFEEAGGCLLPIIFLLLLPWLSLLVSLYFYLAQGPLDPSDPFAKPYHARGYLDCKLEDYLALYYSQR